MTDFPNRLSEVIIGLPSRYSTDWKRSWRMLIICFLHLLQQSLLLSRALVALGFELHYLFYLFSLFLCPFAL